MMDHTTALCNTTECKERLAQELNNEMMSALMPVTVFMAVAALLGALCNVVVLYVYMFRYRVCNFRYFVLCLAAIDLTACVTAIPGEIISFLHWYVYPVPIVCKIKTFFIAFTYGTPALLLLVIALDRFLKVRRPYGWQLQPRVALILCVCITGIASVVAVPAAIFFGTQTNTIIFKDTNITVTMCNKDQKFAGNFQPYVYDVSLVSFILVLVSVTVILYIGTAREICRQTRPSVPAYTRSSGDERNKLVNSTGQEQESGSPSRRSSEGRQPPVPRRPSVLGESVLRRTLISFLLTAIFTATYMVSSFLGIYFGLTDQRLHDLTDAQTASYVFFLRLYFVNHAVNPIIYAFLDSECRKVFRDILPCSSSSVTQSNTS